MRQAYLKTRRKDETTTDEADTEELVARAVVDLAMRIGETAMLCGATAAQSARMVRRVARAYRLPVHVDATYTRIMVGYHPSIAKDPITTIRVVPAGMITTTGSVSWRSWWTTSEPASWRSARRGFA